VTTTPQQRPRVRISGADLRLLGTCLAGSVLLCVMTGPPGSTAAPTSGFTDSLGSPRVIGFLAFGLVLWAIMTTGRKVRSGELASLAETRRGAREWCATTWDLGLHDRTWRRTIGATTFLLSVLLALFVADLTGPNHSDKISYGGLRHQFTSTYTYGYLLLGIVFWVLASRRVLERHGVRTPRPPRAGPAHTAMVVIGCVLGALVLAFAADPWLVPTVHGSYASFTGHQSIFHHWPTYLWLAGSLVVARRILKIEGRRPRQSSLSARPPFLTPQLSLALYVTALFIAIEWPKFLSAYWQSDMSGQIAVFALLALGLNVVVGYTGLLDLGYVAFYAVGAYTAAFFVGALPHQPPHDLNLFWIMPIGIGMAMLAGVLLGLPTLRVRGDYLAIVTLGFGEIIEVTLNNWTSQTYGSAGTRPIPALSINFLGIHYSWNNAVPLPYYYLILGFIVVAIFIFSSLNNSRVGRRWASVREDEHAAASIGVSPLKYKVMAFAIGASTAGFAGVFVASTTTSLFPLPSNFGLQLSILILALVIFGGMGSIVGVLVGAALFKWLQLYLQLHPFPGYLPSDFFMYVGAMFILLMIFRPGGLVPSRRRKREISLAEQGIGFADPMGVEHTQESDQFERPASSESVLGEGL
jgi:branched-chain amino acid transport system permease protein